MRAGRAELVLPDGRPFDKSVKTLVKEQLRNECNLHTVVNLLNGMFALYGH